MNIYVIGSILGLVVLTVGGDIFLKQASEKDHMFLNFHFLIGTIMYALGAFAWTFAFRYLKMGVVAGIDSALTLVFLTSVGCLIYGEKLSGREIFGISLALISLIILIGKE